MYFLCILENVDNLNEPLQSSHFTFFWKFTYHRIFLFCRNSPIEVFVVVMNVLCYIAYHVV